MPLAFNPCSASSGSGVIPWKLQASDYTAKAGDRILVDASSGSWVLTLPQAQVGDEIDLFGVSRLEVNHLNINLGDAKFENQLLVSLKLIKNDYVKLIYIGDAGWMATNKFNLEIKVPAVSQELLLDKYPGAGLALSFRQLSKHYQNDLISIVSTGSIINAKPDSKGEFDSSVLGARISAWYDQSGNNLHASRGDARQPILNKTNNRYAAFFDNNAILSIPAFDYSLLVGSPIDISIFIIFQAQPKTTAILDNSYPSTGQIGWYPEADGTNYLGIENATSQGAIFNLNYNSPSVVGLIRNNTSLRVCQNGQDKFSRSFSPATFASKISGLNIGSEPNITPYFLKGYIAELIIYPKAMENYKEIINYMNAYYQFY